MRISIFALVVFMTSLQAIAAERVIFDTDLGADCDDAGAIAILHALADKGEIDIVAMGIVNPHPDVVPAADAINTYYGRPNIPIGVIKSKPPFNRNRYLKSIVATHPHDLKHEAAPDVVKLYRKVLRESPDNSVILVVVGPPTNIANLLLSPPDEVSGLDGADLCTRKVKFYAAGGNGRGNLPKGEAGWNYKDDIPAAAKELELFPSHIPTVFAGGSGMKIKVGECLKKASEKNPTRMAFEEYFKGKPNMDRNAWDELRVLYGCRPSVRELFETSPFGDISIDEKGVIEWKAEPNRNRAYAYVKESEMAKVKAELEALMLYEPKSSASAGEKAQAQPK